MDFNYTNAEQTLVVKAEVSGIETLANLRGKTVGAQIGTAGAFAIDTAAGVTKREYDEIGLAIEDLTNGRIDAVVCDTPAQYSIENPDYKGKAVVLEYKKPSRRFQDIETIGEPLHRDLGTGELQEIIEKFSAIVESSPPIRRAELLPYLDQLKQWKEQVESKVPCPVDSPWMWQHWNAGSLEVAEEAIEQDQTFKEEVKKQIAQAAGKGAPAYVLAVYSSDFAEASGKEKPAHRWLLDEVQFGTMLYCYLRGSKDGKALAMTHVCKDWEQRDCTPMNFDSIKTKKGQAIAGRLPEKLDKALADAGFPYVPPHKRIERPNAGKMGKAPHPAAHTEPYYSARRKVNSK